jgi:hypothetical protein
MSDKGNALFNASEFKISRGVSFYSIYSKPIILAYGTIQ